MGGDEGPVIETSRLILRPWVDADIEPWVAMNADPRVMKYFASPAPRADSEAAAARLRPRLAKLGYGWWIAEVKGGARFIGAIALQDVPFEAPFTPALEVGWRLMVDAWGNGYATEGARALLAFAFDTLGRDEVVSMTSALNTPSSRVMERLGMTRDPADDFDNPRVQEGHPIRRHVLYRIRRPAA